MKKYITNFFALFIGCVLASIGTSCFLLPNQLSSGGFTGIATILYYLFEWKVGTIILIMNIPLFLLAYIKLGKDFFFSSIIATVLFSKFIDFFVKYPIINDDKFLASIYGGIFTGVGLALVFKGESSTGGSDLIGQLAKAYNHKLKIANIMVGIDFVIVFLNIIFFKTISIGLYSFVAIYIIEKMVDLVFEGINFCKAIYIISDKSEKISSSIIKIMDKGLTGFYGKGMYSQSDKMILLCVTNKRNIGMIKELVNTIDNNAFLIIVDAREVYGLGFKN